MTNAWLSARGESSLPTVPEANLVVVMSTDDEVFGAHHIAAVRDDLKGVYTCVNRKTFAQKLKKQHHWNNRHSGRLNKVHVLLSNLIVGIVLEIRPSNVSPRGPWYRRGERCLSFGDVGHSHAARWRSQTFTVLSALPVTTWRRLDLNLAAVTLREWPVRVSCETTDTERERQPRLSTGS